MKNISVFLSALVALLFSVAETSAQITPPYYNPANVRITGGTINGTAVGETTPANATVSRLRLGASNDLYLTRYAAKQVMISGDGIGATTNAGIIAGYYGSSSVSALWNSTIVPASDNYGLALAAASASLNGTVFSDLRAANVSKFSATATLNTSANPLSVTDTTDSSSTITGSLKTAGGLGVAKKAYFGDKIILNSVPTSTYSIDINLSGSNTASMRLTNANRGIVIKNDSEVVIQSLGTAQQITFRAGSVNNGNYSFDSSGSILLTKTITATGTTGDQTINKMTGRVNFAAAAASLVVTNSLVTANSIIHCTVATNDTTMKSASCVPAAGSFTIRGNANPTAETAVAFTVTN